MLLLYDLRAAGSHVWLERYHDDLTGSIARLDKTKLTENGKEPV